MAHFLIKRSNAFRELHRNNSSSKSYFEITIRNKRYNPPSAKINVGDMVYVAETNGGIYAKGNVVKTNEVEEFTCIEDVLAFSKKFNDEAYWIDKIRVFSERLQEDRNYRLRCHQYFINQKLLINTIPYNGPLTKYDASVKKGLASIFFKLTNEDVTYLEGNPDYSLRQVGTLKPEIPGSLRLKIYSFFNRNHAISHLIDIDHFVPKSVGGPGNIIENLVPIGFSLNRYKNDSIPKSFFVLATRDEYQSKLSTSKKDMVKLLGLQDDFISTRKYPEAKKIAISINASIQKWDISDARQFYLKVSHAFNPQYVQQLKLLEKELY
jgi:hypothetical protein